MTTLQSMGQSLPELHEVGIQDQKIGLREASLLLLVAILCLYMSIPWASIPEKPPPTNRTQTSTLSPRIVPTGSLRIPSGWAVSASSNVELLVTAPDGRQTGIDPATGRYVQAIPDSTYGTEHGIAPPDGSTPKLPDRQYFAQNDPQPGVYSLRVSSIQGGPYFIDIVIITRSDASSNVSKHLSGQLGKGTNVDYAIDMTSWIVVRQPAE